MSSTSKIPLALAADNFAIVCKAIDEGNLNETITALFHETKLDLADSVARRVCFLEHLDGAIANARDIRDSWKTKVDHLEHVAERVKKMTLEIMSAEQSVEYRSPIGNLCAQNSPSAVRLNFETTNKSLSNVLNPKDIEYHMIPPELITETSALQLNKEKLKEQLNAGRTYPWATLTQSQHLRIRK